MDSQDKSISGPSGSDAETETTETTETTRTASWTPVIALGVAALVCAIAAGIFFQQRASAEDGADGRVSAEVLDAVGLSAGDGDNSAFLDAAETQRVAAAAQIIVTTVFSYDYTNIDTHADRVQQLVTPEMFAQYESTSPPTSEMVKQAQTTTVGTVPEGALGVRSIIGDTAEVDVVLAAMGDNGGVPTFPAKLPLRLTLQQVDGQWIASAITPL